MLTMLFLFSLLISYCNELWPVAPRTSSSCHVKHLFVFFIFFLLVCFRRLSTFLPRLCVILVLLCVFVYYYCMCLKSHTFIFLFLLGLHNVYFLSSHGSSLIGSPFRPSFCLSVVFVHVTRAVSWFT